MFFLGSTLIVPKFPRGSLVFFTQAKGQFSFFKTRLLRNQYSPNQRPLVSRTAWPFLLSERSLELNFRGSRNQRVLNVPESLKQGQAVLETSGRWLGEY